MIVVSIVMPAHNRADMVADAISSVLQQTFQALELVIVDDGSTDQTRETVLAFQDPRIRYIFQEHSGVSAALNRGWQAARSEWIGRLDSDDRWHPQFLETVLDRLHANPEAILGYARAQWMDISGNLLAPLLGAREKFPGQTLKSLLYGDFIAPMAVVIQRNSLERVGGYDESLIANEDWDLWIRLAELGPFVFVDKVLAFYRVHSQNLTASSATQNLRLIADRKRVLDKYYMQPTLPKQTNDVKALAYRNLHEDIGMRHLQAHRWRSALASFKSAIMIAPNPFEACIRIVRNIVFAFTLNDSAFGTLLRDRWSRQGSKIE